MQAEKLSISIPNTSMLFLEQYRQKHALKSRSQVIDMAIALLREKDLESAYRAASDEADYVIDGTASDGLTDETW